MHILFFLITLLMPITGAKAGPVERINEIKLDPSFIYGEATKPTSAEAYDAALNVLQSNIQLWHEQNDKTGRMLRNLSFLADTIHATRGNFQRVFAFVSIDKIKQTIENDAKQVANRKKEGFSGIETSGGSLHEDPTLDAALRKLVGIPLFNDFVTQVEIYQHEGMATEASRDVSKMPNSSYLAVFNKTSKGEPLLYLLSPGKGRCNDIISGGEMDTDVLLQHKNSYKFLWFVLSPTNNLKK